MLGQQAPSQQAIYAATRKRKAQGARQSDSERHVHVSHAIARNQLRLFAPTTSPMASCTPCRRAFLCSRPRSPDRAMRDDGATDVIRACWLLLRTDKRPLQSQPGATLRSRGLVALAREKQREAKAGRQACRDMGIMISAAHKQPSRSSMPPWPRGLSSMASKHTGGCALRPARCLFQREQRQA